MACNLATIQSAACDSGIGKLTAPVAVWQVVAQSLLTASPTPTDTVDDVMDRACASGIGYLTDENALMRITSQNLCMVNAEPTPVPETCDSITLSGASGLGAVVNQTYTKTSDSLFVGNDDSRITIVFDSGSGLWTVQSTILSLLGILYTQNGTFPETWIANGDALNPSPTGVCN